MSRGPLATPGRIDIPAARRLDVNACALRYYEECGLVRLAERSRRRRLYDLATFIRSCNSFAFASTWRHGVSTNRVSGGEGYA
ncbi:MerR family transcriptional regulator [Streptosporangium subroseum]|uniref:MerR family transcriptional regulator n=1 Tax=Streptosporangium subroseum TaxID=106412 RepID=UPI003422C189